MVGCILAKGIGDAFAIFSTHRSAQPDRFRGEIVKRRAEDGIRVDLDQDALVGIGCSSKRQHALSSATPPALRPPESPPPAYSARPAASGDG